MSNVEYRLSQGCLLRCQRGVVITAFVNGTWKTYPEVVEDWYTNSRPLRASDKPLIRKLLGDKQLHESAVLFESVQHAPKGGATINGKEFIGGQFIPGADLEKASPTELKELGEKQQAQGKESKPDSKKNDIHSDISYTDSKRAAITKALREALGKEPGRSVKALTSASSPRQANAILKAIGFNDDEARKGAEAFEKALVEHAKAFGIEVPQRLASASPREWMDPEARKAKELEDNKRWFTESMEKRQKLVAKAKEFAEAHFADKEQPPPEKCTQTQWVALQIKRKMTEVQKDKAKLDKLMAMHEKLYGKFDFAGTRQDYDAQIARMQAENPNWYADLDKLNAEESRPVYRKLIKKYTADFYSSPNLLAASESVNSLEKQLQQAWDGNPETGTGIVGFYGWGPDVPSMKKGGNKDRFRPAIDHAEAVKRFVTALASAPDAVQVQQVSDDVLEDYWYDGWIPTPFLRRHETKELIREADAWPKTPEGIFATAELNAAMKRAEPKLNALIGSGAEYPPQLKQAQDKLKWYQESSDKAAKELDGMATEWSKLAQSQGACETKEEWDEIGGKMEALSDTMSKKADACTNMQRMLSEAERQIAQIKHDAGQDWLVKMLPKKTAQVTINTMGADWLTPKGIQNAHDAGQFLSRCVSDKFGTKTGEIDSLVEVRVAQINPLVVEPFRAYYTGGELHINPDQNVSTIVHECGHAIDGLHYNSLGRFSKAFAAQQIAKSGQTNNHLGEMYRPNEVGAQDKFRDKYVGKYYSDDSSEVLSMGLQFLYDDPIDFYEKSPEHFKYTIAAINGLL